MYPWFGGLQPWITGYYFLPVGVYLLVTRWMFLNDVLSYTFSLVDSLALLVLLLVSFVFSIVGQFYARKILVIAGSLENDGNLPEKAED